MNLYLEHFILCVFDSFVGLCFIFLNLHSVGEYKGLFYKIISCRLKFWKNVA